MSINTEVCNLALSHIGSSHTIADADTEKSAAAQRCRVFFSIALEKTLRDFPWPFATKIVRLALIEKDPNDEWGFSYRYPADCLFIRRFLNGRNETRDSRVPYKITADNQGRLILTDKEFAQIEYTVNLTDFGLMTSDFIMAFSFLLAHYIAPSLTAGDPFKLGAAAFTKYENEISGAKATAINEEQVDEPPESELERARR